MAKRKRKIKIHYPNEFPYVLFDVQTGKTHKYTVAHDEEQLKARVDTKKNSKVKPVQVIDIIQSKGHKEANLFLRSFGARWVCKEGRVFFRELTE
jgi:hypothetical protein